MQFLIGELLLYTLLSRNVFPEGLPPSYVFVSTQRFKVRKTWDLWRILSLDGRPQIAFTINGEDKTLSFTTTSIVNYTQTVTFTAPRVKVKDTSLAIGRITSDLTYVFNCMKR